MAGSYLEPNRNSMHKPIGGRSLLAFFQTIVCWKQKLPTMNKDGFKKILIFIR